MKLTIDFDANNLIKEIMQNEPEYSSGCILQCSQYNYETCQYSFVDTTNEKKYMVHMGTLQEGLEKMLSDLINNNLKGFKYMMPVLWQDAGNWDLPMVDALVQYSIFGKLIYG